MFKPLTYHLARLLWSWIINYAVWVICMNTDWWLSRSIKPGRNCGTKAVKLLQLLQWVLLWLLLRLASVSVFQVALSSSNISSEWSSINHRGLCGLKFLALLRS